MAPVLVVSGVLARHDLCGIEAVNAVELLVLRKMQSGPQWSQSLRAAKPVVVRLVSRGLLERVRSQGGTARNMGAITQAGRAILEKQNAPD